MRSYTFSKPILCINYYIAHHDKASKYFMNIFFHYINQYQYQYVTEVSCFHPLGEVCDRLFHCRSQQSDNENFSSKEFATLAGITQNVLRVIFYNKTGVNERHAGSVARR